MFNVNIRCVVAGGSVGSSSMMNTVAVSHTVSVPSNLKSTKNDSVDSETSSLSTKMVTSDSEAVLNVKIPLDPA